MLLISLLHDENRKATHVMELPKPFQNGRVFQNGRGRAFAGLRMWVIKPNFAR
jgi:hypothetical protein